MAQQRKDWASLIRSVHRSRAPSARFFKPVCVIAAIDLADLGRLDPDLLHSEMIERRFGEYVAPNFPDRASNGWQPLWALSNDGLWKFYRKGKPLDRRSFERTLPRTRRKLFDAFDVQAISPGYRMLWDSTGARQELRDQMMLMLSEDAECRPLLRPLLDRAQFDRPENWPDDARIADYLRSVGGQSDLFTRTAESGAGSAREGLAAFDVDALPPASAVGPEFLATGETPVALNHLTRAVSAIQADLHRLLLIKCRVLQRAVPTASNRSAHLRHPLNAFADALGKTPETAERHIIWSHGNTLRRLDDADIRARASPDPDSLPLPEQVGELLSDLVEQFNVYAQQDPLLRELDNARIGPSGRAELLERLRSGAALVGALRNSPLVMDKEAAEVLATATATAEAASGTSGLNADQAIVNAVEMQRNGIRALLQSALLEAKRRLKATSHARKSFVEGAAKQAGAEAIKQIPFVRFVTGFSTYVRAMWKGEKGSNVIEQLLDWFSALRW
ncbi:hypothetical protein [Sphingosinicella terrae]|uniref:hypothetical protein n=1 Tax=Sphingosinicella terrae TaxID=2172047 RepID=UPI000E0DEC06|nr:hypothetical protein [Sphingosinicella terrae]